MEPFYLVIVAYVLSLFTLLIAVLWLFFEQKRLRRMLNKFENIA